MNINFALSNLEPSSKRTGYDLHCAAVEWSLADPIIINSAEDIKSRADWQGRVEPYKHQVENLMRFCRRLPCTLLADDVGLGKTISAGLILSELMKRNRIKRVFIICPKILIEQWKEELDSKFGIQAIGLTGSELRRIDGRNEPVILTTYQSATGYLQKKKIGEFDMLILDEAHKVRNLHGSSGNPPKMATAIYEALESRVFKYVLMLTATPIQNRLWDIYSLIDCLAVARGHRNPLGNPDSFANRFIEDGRAKARKLVPQRAEEFRQVVGTYMFRTRRLDAELCFPDRVVQTHPVNPSRMEIALQYLLAEHIDRFNPLNRVNLLVALMSSPQALASQLVNMAKNQTAPSWLAREADQLAKSIPIPAKTEFLLSMAETLKKNRSDWRMVVFTTRKETQKTICDVLASRGIKLGTIMGANPGNNRRTIENFRCDPPEINVVVSTDAGAEGINLQVANVLVNYDLPWNPMIVEQRIGRVQRIGSKFSKVVVSNIVHRNSPEQLVVARLLEKLQVISHTVGDIEAVLEAADDSNGESLQKQICRMVVDSLHGQNMEVAARKALASIERAKALIDENEREIEQTLGSTTGDESTLTMPRLSTKAPRMPLNQFVLEALYEEGNTIVELGNGLFRATSANVGEEKFTFDEETARNSNATGVFHGRGPALYAYGKPAFERLLQRWLQRDSIWIEENDSSHESVEGVVAEWLTKFDGLQQNIELSQTTGRLTGKAVCRVRIANSMDSYEKLLEVPFKTAAVNTSKLAELGGDLLRKLKGLDRFITATVERDPDVAKFQKYYATKRDIDLEKSDHGPRRDKILFDYRESIVAEVSAAEMGVVNLPTATVHYQVDGHSYTSVLTVESGRIVREPEFAQCYLNNKAFPVECLGTSSVSGKKCLKHLLVRSDGSGEFALPDEMISCAVSNGKYLPSEIETCAVSNKLVYSELMFSSEVSGLRAHRDFKVSCELTGAGAFEDELVRSGISEKSFRKDQAVELADGLRGHVSEAERCQFSNRWYPKGACIRSHVSDKLIAPDRIVYSETSSLPGDQSEAVTCSLTGKQLLVNETEKCDVTGDRVVLGSLATCSASGKRAKEDCLVVCEVTGNLVHPEYTVKCEVTGKMISIKSAAKSELSERWCIKGSEVVCEKTGRRLIPDEIGKCEISGRFIAKDRLQTCCVSDHTAFDGLLTKSAYSGRWAKKEHVEIVDGLHAIKGEITTCPWTHLSISTTKTDVCKISGIRMAKGLLNGESEMRLLRSCLDGLEPGRPFPAMWLFQKYRPKEFSKVTDVRWIASEDGKTHMVCGKKSFLGFNTKHFAFFVNCNEKSMMPFGPVIWGRRKNGHWIQDVEEAKSSI